MKLQRVAGPAALTGVALVAIATLTLRPAPAQILDAQRTPLDCLVCGDVGGADVLLNIALFVPLGLGLFGLRRSLRFTVTAALMLSLSIELLQYTVVIGRDATLSDVLTNTAGGALGWLLGAFGLRLLAPSRRAAAILAGAATLAWIVAYAVSAWALHPAPSGGSYWGQWNHDFPDRGTFAGRVSLAELDGVALPDGPIQRTAVLRRRLASGGFDLVVRATSGRAEEDNAQIFGLANDEGDIFLEWRQKDRDYEFTMRGRAALLRFHSPELLLRGAAPGRPGAPVTLDVSWHDGVITASAASVGRVTTRVLVLAPSVSWTFVWPWNRDRGGAMKATGAAWLGISVLMIGFWAGTERRKGAAAEGWGWPGLLCGAVIAAVLLMGPAVAGLQPTSAADWAGAALGFLFGSLARRYMPRARSASGP